MSSVEASGLADLPSVVCRVENTKKSGLGCLVEFVPRRSKNVFPSVSSPQAFCPAKKIKPVQNCNISIDLLSYRRKLVASSKQYLPVNLVEQRSESKNWI